MRVVKYTLWDLENPELFSLYRLEDFKKFLRSYSVENPLQVVLYVQGLEKILSSFAIERPCANYEDMKHDLYVICM